MATIRPVGATLLSFAMAAYGLAMAAVLPLGIARHPDLFPISEGAISVLIIVLAGLTAVGAWRLARWAKSALVLFAGSIALFVVANLANSPDVHNSDVWLGVMIGGVGNVVLFWFLYRYLDRVTRPAV